MSALRLFSTALLCALAAQAQAQTTAPVAPATAGATVPFSEPDTVVDAAARKAAIEEMADDLVENYVFLDVAKAMAADLRRREKNGEYDQLTSARAFAQRMQENLLAICHDKHVRVRYREPRPAEARQTQASAPADGLDRNTRFGRMSNYGFAKFEQLEGNIAYLELRNFQDAKSGAQTVAAAMGMAAHAEALIIDLRRNGGGSPAMVALITSYLYGKERVHLNDLYWRKDNRTESFWTDPDVPGLRFGPDKPVYILTSGRTFSAAEEFSYNLKNLKRATLVSM
jgi:retinol-binding protein 3